MYSDNIEGEWSAFNDILRRKDNSISTQVASLQMKIVSEDKVVESKTTDLLSEWEKEKPVEVCNVFSLVYLLLFASPSVFIYSPNPIGLTEVLQF